MRHYYKLFCYCLFGLFFISSCSQKTGKQLSEEEPFNIEEATIADIHQAIKTGRCTCEQLVQTYLDRIEKYDQPTKLNAIVTTNPDALQRAIELDKEYVRTGNLQKLHCIPVIVKDNYNTKDLQTTAGSLALKGFEPEQDAYQVKALKEAGAIVLAKSNMAEWAFSPMVSISSTAGETLNPYNLGQAPVVVLQQLLRQT